MKGFVQNLSGYLGAETNSSAEDTEVIAYSLQILVSTVLGYIVIFVVGWLMGVLALAILSTIVVSSIRVFSGGAHASSPANCIGFGGFIFPAIGLVARWGEGLVTQGSDLIPLIIVAWTFAIWSVYKFAPAETPEKPISTQVQRDKLKRLSFLSLVFWLVVAGTGISPLLWELSPAIIISGTLGLVWQSFTLTPLGYKFIGSVDGVVRKISLGRQM